jgi:hypothetical protein
MTYDIYAMFKEGSYKVAEGNDADHATDLAERMCKNINQWPMGFAALIRSEHTIKGPILSFDDLKNRK